MDPGGRIDRYEVSRQLGRGAFATVYAVRDEALDSNLALKLLDPLLSADIEVRERFLQEARLLRRADSPDLVRVYDVGETGDGRAWFVMTRADRGSLAERIEQRGGPGRVTAADVGILASCLDRGLTALHRRGIVHRDVSPRNLLITSGAEPGGGERHLLDPDERILISDLGLAKDLTDGADALTLLGGTPRYRPPEQTAAMGRIDQRADVYAATAVVWEVVTGTPPPLVHEQRGRLLELTDGWRRFIGRGMAPDPGLRHENIEEWHAGLRHLLEHGLYALAPPVAPAAGNPYPGLAPYRADRAGFFSGREVQIDELITRLRRQRAVVVGGAPGAGTSSLLQAGLGPAVAGGALGGGLDWTVVTFRPGTDPLGRLLHALGAQLERTPTRTGVAADPGAVAAALDRPGRAVLLIADQFEEVVAPRVDPAVRDLVVAVLQELAEVGATTRVVIAVRSDHYGQLGRSPWLSGLLRHHVFVGPMQPGELRRAVERPAIRAGGSVEDELVEAVLDDARHSGTLLPHHSHALALTWAQRSGNRMTLAAYRELGGISGALRATAEAFVSGLGPREVELLRPLLLAMVTPGSRCRPDSRASVELAGLSSGERDLVERLAGSRLVSVTDGEVQLAHQTLLSDWPTLVVWIDESRAELATGRALRHAAAEWDDHGRSPDLLLRGAALDRALTWAAGAVPPLGPVERELVERSRRLRARVVTVQRAGGVGLALLVVAVALSALVAWRQSAAASAASDVATSRRLAAESMFSLGRNDRQLAGLLAVAGSEVAPTVEARDALAAVVVADLDDAEVLRGHEGDVRALAAGRDGSLASGGDDGTVRLWTAGEEPLVIAAHDGEVRDLVFLPGGDRLVSVGSDGRVALWDGTSGRSIGDRVVPAPAPGSGIGTGQGGGGAAVSGPVADLRAVDVTPDGSAVVIAGDGGLWFWDLDADDPPVLFRERAVESRDVAVAPDGGRVAVADRDGMVTVVALPGGETLARHPDPHLDAALAVAWAAGGSVVVSAGRDRTVRTWDVGTGESGVIAAHAAEIFALAVSGDGRTVASASADGLVALWDVGTLEPRGVFRGHEGDVGAVVFDSVGGVDSAGADGTVRRWSGRASGPVVTLTGAGDAVLDIAASDDHRLVVAATRAGVVVRWEPQRATGAAVVTRAHRGVVYAVALVRGDAISAGQDGRVVRTGPDGVAVEVADLGVPLRSLAVDPAGAVAAVGDESGTVTRVDLDTGAGAVIAALSAPVLALAWSADGSTLAVGTGDGVLGLVAADGGAWTLRPVDRTGGAVRTLAFDPLGAFLAAAGDASGISVYDSTGRLLDRLGGGGDVRDVAWSSDGALLVSVGRDETARILDRSLAEVASVQVHRDDNRAVHVGVGATIVSASNSGEVKIWPGPGSWVEAACGIAGRELTGQERSRYLGADTAPTPLCRP